jgi:hypothetical protein
LKPWSIVIRFIPEPKEKRMLSIILRLLFGSRLFRIYLAPLHGVHQPTDASAGYVFLSMALIVP